MADKAVALLAAFKQGVDAHVGGAAPRALVELQTQLKVRQSREVGPSLPPPPSPGSRLLTPTLPMQAAATSQTVESGGEGLPAPSPLCTCRALHTFPRLLPASPSQSCLGMLWCHSLARVGVGFQRVGWVGGGGWVGDCCTWSQQLGGTRPPPASAAPCACSHPWPCCWLLHVVTAWSPAEHYGLPQPVCVVSSALPQPGPGGLHRP
jgi:hypothetical protein